VALGSLVWGLATLHIAGGLKRYDHCGPSQPRPFCDLERLLLRMKFTSVVCAGCLSQVEP